MSKWQIDFEKDCKAVKKINEVVSRYVDYPVPCNVKNSDSCRIVLKTDSAMDGYSIIARDNKIEITAKDEINLLYAASDFKNKLIPFWKNPSAKASHYFIPFTDEPPQFELITKPKIDKRGIWTWGHVIYDYKKFIDNMVALRLNTLIIWNDYVPTNIKEVLNYAHENGVYIYLGFAWGWDQKCAEQIKDLDTMPETIAKKYEREYSSLDCDGIYFQTFTELDVEEINGVTIADAAVELVNKTAALIYAQKPELEILFGLHATSVSTKLDIIAKKDPRITVMWEDLGSFPYGYVPSVIKDFEKTLELQRKIREKLGSFTAVLKGVACLDWTTFKHQEGPFVMGECSKEFILKKLEEKRDLLRYVQAHWIKNAKYAHEIIKDFSKDDIITVLCEDCVFEEVINYPMAIYAQMLWDSDRSTEDILCECALMDEVTFI
ncbi:MAG: hypothetical protein IJ408_04045 [Clostridia bacterium]|nr:hypothetical protein [Clostridia bacterium]